MPILLSYTQYLDHIQSLNNHLKEKEFPSKISVTVIQTAQLPMSIPLEENLK